MTLKTWIWYWKEKSHFRNIIGHWETFGNILYPGYFSKCLFLFPKFNFLSSCSNLETNVYIGNNVSKVLWNQKQCFIFFNSSFFQTKLFFQSYVSNLTFVFLIFKLKNSFVSKLKSCLQCMFPIYMESWKNHIGKSV